MYDLAFVPQQSKVARKYVPIPHVRLWVFGQGSNPMPGTAKSGGFQLRRAETLLFRFLRKTLGGVKVGANLGNYSGSKEMR